VFHKTINKDNIRKRIFHYRKNTCHLTSS